MSLLASMRVVIVIGIILTIASYVLALLGYLEVVFFYILMAGAVWCNALRMHDRMTVLRRQGRHR